MKPTIADLEACLDRSDLRIEILPNGEIRAVGPDESVPSGPVEILTLKQALGDNY